MEDLAAMVAVLTVELVRAGAAAKNKERFGEELGRQRRRAQAAAAKHGVGIPSSGAQVGAAAVL